MTATGRGGLGPSREQSFIESEMPRLMSRAKEKRLSNYEKRHVEVFDDGRDIDPEPDGRRPGAVWRARDGRLFEEMRPLREPGDAPDGVVIVHGATVADTTFLELRLLDIDVYQLESARHAQVVEQGEAELAAAEAEIEEARRRAPKHVLRSPGSSWCMSDLLAAVARTHGRITQHGTDRILVELPVAPHLIYSEPQYVNAVTQLRPLLVASKVGTARITCDAPECERDAEHVAIGGAFVCTVHA
jgi:hypothetical protein